MLTKRIYYFLFILFLSETLHSVFEKKFKQPTSFFNSRFFLQKIYKKLKATVFKKTVAFKVKFKMKSIQRCRSFNQHGCFVVQHLYKTALDREAFGMAFILQNFYVALA